MHRHVNVLQYVKTPAGRWQWAPIPRNPRTGDYVCSKAKSRHFYIVWREHDRGHYQKAGTTPATALEAQRRKEYELAGRAVLDQGKKIPKPKDGGLTIEGAVADFLEFLKKKRRPNTLKRYRAVLDHFRLFFKPYVFMAAIKPADIDAYRDQRLEQTNPRGKKLTARRLPQSWCQPMPWSNRWLPSSCKRLFRKWCVRASAICCSWSW